MQQQQNGKTLDGEFDPFHVDVMRSIEMPSAPPSEVGSDVFVDRISMTSTISTMSDVYACELNKSFLSNGTPAAPLYPKECVALYTSFQSKRSPAEVQARVELALTDVSARFIAKKDRFKTKASMKDEQVSFSVRIYTLPNVRISSSESL
jgi:hypothetical protein